VLVALVELLLALRAMIIVLVVAEVAGVQLLNGYLHPQFPVRLQ
jgi:hypothetical protein